MPLNESNRRWAGSRTGRRLAACLLAISAVVILAGAAVQVYLEYRHDREEIDVTLRQAHGSLESLITQSLWLTNDDMLANTVRGLLSLPYITEVTVDKRDGTRLSEMRAAARQPLVHAHDIIKIYRDRPVPLGHITVTADLAIVFSNLFKQARLRIAIQATLAITLAAAAMILFHRQIGRHLSRMSNYSQSLTIDTLDAPLVLEKRIPADSRADDIDRLALAINDMREKLRGSLDSLQQSEERFDLAMQFANDGLFDWNLATNEIYYSRGWKKMLGYEPHEIKNEFSEWERLTQPDDVADSWNMLREVIDGKRPRFEMEFRMRHKDGHWVDVLSRANVLRDDRGKAIRVVGTHVDITERKAMESRLRENQRLESIGTLAGGIAHDFNNLLYPIVGRAEMLMEDFSPGSLEHECAEEIFKAAMRGSELVQQILVISRRTPQKKVAAKLSGIVAEAVKLARSTIPADIDIAVHIEDRDGMVLAAPSQLHQVVMNLITNAYHALETDGGTITVGLQQADDAETMVAGDSRDARPHLKLTVADTGCGIDPAEMDKIYEPYFTTKAPGKGTGLGLAVVFGIVKDLDGEITIHSEVNQGTRVEIRLPRMASEASREDPVPVPEDIAGGHECILLVEDEPPIAKMASRMLERMGYRVESHLNSREALQCFKRNPDGYDLVITDATMPQITGDRLAAEIRALRPGLPIVICSGFSERLNPAKLHALGINRVLMKPITKSELARTVRKVLDQTIGTDSRSEG